MIEYSGEEVYRDSDEDTEVILTRRIIGCENNTEDTLPCMISIKSVQVAEDGEHFETTCESTGQLSDDNGTIVIEYDESIEGTDGVTHNEIRIHGTEMQVVRSGAVSSTMRFKPQESFEFLHETPLGAFEFEAQTRSFALTRDERKMEIWLNYELFSGKVSVSVNEIYWSIRLQ